MPAAWIAIKHYQEQEGEDGKFWRGEKNHMIVSLFLFRGSVISFIKHEGVKQASFDLWTKNNGKGHL